MRPVSFESYVGWGSRLAPLLARESNRMRDLLESSSVFVSPDAYMRLVAASILYPCIAESFILLLRRDPLGVSLLAPFLAIQFFPLVFPYYRRWRRKHGVESELPFVTMLVYILSHESLPTLNDILTKVKQLGNGTFPSFSREAAILERNLTYENRSELSVTENYLSRNPSAEFRSVANGYLSAMAAGRDLQGFAHEESARLVALLEEKWRAFSQWVASLAEVSFIFLAILPTGLQMITTTFVNVGSGDLLLLSFVLLAVVSVAILIAMDALQPEIQDEKYSTLGVISVTTVWASFSLLYGLGWVTISVAVVPTILVSALFWYFSRKHYARLHSSENEVGLLLHDFAEESRAGASLPVAASKLLLQSKRYPELRAPLGRFEGLLALGHTPIEAQRRVRHPSWLVRVSFALLAVAFETGSGFDQLERLSMSFKRITSARRALATSVLPLVLLGISVPMISGTAVWFLNSMAGLGSILPGLGAVGQLREIPLSISSTSFLSALIVSKAYTLSVRNVFPLTPIFIATLASTIIFGLR